MPCQRSCAWGDVRAWKAMQATPLANTYDRTDDLPGEHVGNESAPTSSRASSASVTLST